MASKGSLVAIIIPTLNENPDMVKETILKAKNVDYEMCPKYWSIISNSFLS